MGKSIFIIPPLVVKSLSMPNALRVMDALEVIGSWLESEISGLNVPNYPKKWIAPLILYICGTLGNEVDFCMLPRALFLHLYFYPSSFRAHLKH